MNECVENAHQRVLVIPQQLHRDLTRDPKHTFHARHAQSVNHVLCQTKRNTFGDFQRFTLEWIGLSTVVMGKKHAYLFE